MQLHPFHQQQLKYIDFANSTTNNLNIGVDENERFSTGVKSVDESNIITRMAFANDGVGYALTNDAKSFMRFTTNESSTITNLGEIRDSKRNTSVSIHNQCTSWGGDMIGDIYGNLFLISMRNNVFKINIAKLEAEYIGTITNLPATFTTNGAVADDDGNMKDTCEEEPGAEFRMDEHRAFSLPTDARERGKIALQDPALLPDCGIEALRLGRAQLRHGLGRIAFGLHARECAGAAGRPGQAR